MKKTGILVFLKIMICIIMCASCSFQSDSFNKTVSVKDISKYTGYEKIVTQGFMGGSVIYNPSDQSLGQLANGVSIAVRFSKAKSTDVGNGRIVFGEVENSAQYGLLFVKDITEQIINFSIKIYDVDGTSFVEKNYYLSEGQSVDITGDDIPDIQYKKPVQKRNGYENSVYLDFISSQEDLNISMFAVLTEQYAEMTYPNGIIGVNPDGRFVVSKYTSTSGNIRSVIRGVYKGDYIVDNKEGKYQKVRTNRYARSARAVSDDDLQDMEDVSENTNFYFTDEDFANYSADELLSALPIEIVKKYSEFKTSKDTLNALLKDPELMTSIDSTQGSVLPEDIKIEILAQFITLTEEETVQLNRVFLEKNYPFICPQRVTISEAIIEVLPLASVAITENDTNDNIVEKLDSLELAKENNINNSTSRAASASWVNVNTKEEYSERLDNLKNQFSTYKSLKKYNFIQDFPLNKEKDDVENADKKKIGTITSTISLKDSIIEVGLKGSFNITWSSVNASLGGAVFVKAGTTLDVKVTMNDKILDDLSDSLEYENDKGEIKEEEGKLDVRDFPIINVTKTLWNYERKQKYNIVNFCIGPILISVNLNFKIGIPVSLSLEADTEVSYDCFVAALAQAGVSAGMDYGIRWKKLFWFIKYPEFYFDTYSSTSASADGVFYADITGNSFNINLNKLTANLSISPYASAELDLSVAAIVHGGFELKSGVTGYTSLGYENSYIEGKYGLNYNNSLKAKVFIGLKDFYLFGLIKIGDIGKGWEWELLDKYPRLKKGVIIPETCFLRVGII